MSSLLLINTLLLPVGHIHHKDSQAGRQPSQNGTSVSDHAVDDKHVRTVHEERKRRNTGMN